MQAKAYQCVLQVLEKLGASWGLENFGGLTAFKALEDVFADNKRAASSSFG